MTKIFDHTKSVCPECMQVLDADIYFENGDTKIRRVCPEHGEFVGTHMWDKEWLYRGLRGLYKNVGVPEINFSKLEKDTNVSLYHKFKPRSILVEITPRCNLDCPFCYLGGKGGKMDSIKEMNKNDFKKLIEKYPYIEIFNLSGGEPTLNPNLMSIISFLKKRGKKILIGTNGLKTSDKAFLKNLENAGLDGLMLAFNSYSKKIEKKLRGINLIPSTINAIQNLKKTNLNLKIASNMTKNNIDELKEIYESLIKPLASSWVIDGVIFVVGRKIPGLKKIKLSEILEKFCEEFNVTFDEALKTTKFLYMADKIKDYISTETYKKTMCYVFFFFELKNGKIKKITDSLEFKIWYNVLTFLSNDSVLKSFILFRKVINFLHSKFSKKFSSYRKSNILPVLIGSHMSRENLDLRLLSYCGGLHIGKELKPVTACHQFCT